MRKFTIYLICGSLIVTALSLGVVQDLLNRQKKSHEAASVMQSEQREEGYRRLISKQRDDLQNHQEIVSSQALAIDELKDLLSEALGQEYSGQLIQTRVVTATAYTARKEECDSHPWVTASGNPSRVGAIAVSRDLESLGLKLGDIVIIKGMGSFRVEDRMNKKWTSRIDILHANVAAAKKFAKRDVELMWLDRSEMASL